MMRICGKPGNKLLMAAGGRLGAVPLPQAEPQEHEDQDDHEQVQPPPLRRQQHLAHSISLRPRSIRRPCASAPIPEPDPQTGLIKPSKLTEKTYRLEGNICRRILPPNTQAQPEAHPVPETAKDKSGKGRKKRKG